MTESSSPPVSQPISYLQHLDRTEPFDPPTIVTELTRSQPLARMVYPDGHVGWLATNQELAREVLSSHAFSHNFHSAHVPMKKRGELFPSVPIVPGGFIHMDPPDHTRYRNLLSGEFNTRRMDALAPDVARAAAEQLAELRGKGSPVDLLPSYIRPLSLRLLCQVIGIPFEVSATMLGLVDATNDESQGFEEEREATTKAFFCILDLVGKARTAPGDDIIGRLAAHEELTDREITNMVVIVFAAGFASCEAALAMSLLALLHHRDQLDVFRAAAATGDPAAQIEELLRYTTVNQFQIFRTALADVQLGGELIREGDTVTVALPAANRDPARFADPTRLDLGNDASGHLAFGYGVHACVGQRLARLMLAEALSTLVLELPELALDAALDEVPLRLGTSVLGVLQLPVRY